MVSPEDSANFLEELEKEIHSINSLASIIRSVRGQVDLSNILDCRAYDATVSHAHLHFFGYICTSYRSFNNIQILL